MQYELHHRSSTRLCLGLWKYWDFKSEAKVEQIIAIVTTHSVSCFPRNGFHDSIVDGNILVFYSFKLPFLLHIIFLFFIFYLFLFLFIYFFWFHFFFFKLFTIFCKLKRLFFTLRILFFSHSNLYGLSIPLSVFHSWTTSVLSDPSLYIHC